MLKEIGRNFQSIKLYCEECKHTKWVKKNSVDKQIERHICRSSLESPKLLKETPKVIEIVLESPKLLKETPKVIEIVTEAEKETKKITKKNK